MKPIIVATDFSASALNAAYYAADMALSINGYLILLHVYQVPIATTEMPVMIDIEAMTMGGEKEMQQLKNRLVRHTSGKLIIETELSAGFLFDKLKTLCNDKNPYAVVMGSQGTTAAERFVFGNHTAYAMKHLMWPLIAVPPYVKFSSIKKIGLACDLNKVTESVPVDELQSLVTDFNAELHVLNTGRRNVFDPEIIFQSGLMQELLQPLQPAYHFINSDNIDDGIIDFTDKNAIDLLVVLPKRHTLIEKLTHKSHTKKLVLHSHVPVMALHV